MSRNRKVRIFKSLIAVLLSFTILATSVAKPDFCNTISEKLSCNREVSAFVDTEHLTGEVHISSLEALYQFAKNYHDNPNSYQYKNLIIGMNEAIIISPTREINGTTYTWYPIGTSNKPFAGKITINLNQGNTQNIEVNAPIFDYIFDSVDIVNINDDQKAEGYEPTQILNLVRNSDVGSGETKPLFANNVVHNTDTQITATPSKWHLVAGGDGSYSGIIGTVGTELDNTIVNLDLTINNTSSTIQADDNAGFVCGKIKNGATVNVELNAESTGTVTTVTSDNGNAGFYVGEMCQGSTLNVIRNSVIEVSDAGRTVTGKVYAGGLVGKNDQGTVIIKNTAEGAEEVYDASGTIVATNSSSGAAGGVFGYYKVTADYNRFSPDYYRSTTGSSINAMMSGGLVGELEADGIDVSYSGVDSSHKINVVTTLAGSHNYFGGLIGKYSNTKLEKAFTIEHVNVTMNGNGVNQGGGIATLGGNKAVYVKFDDFTLNATGSVGSCQNFGGVIGTAGSNGSLIDVGNITITTSNKFRGGGVVGKLNTGILRLSGITNLNGAAANVGGQIVGERTNGLVYALGSGNDAASSTYGNGWRLVRSSNDVAIDDIGTWGEVVRINDIENGIISYDSSAHTVTVASAVTNMESASDFVRTALNMQLNDGSNVGALHFDSSSNRTSLLADTNLTISGTINLSGTGITGFMRDGSTSAETDDSEIKFFTGKLSKGESEEGDNDAIIQLAIGERYGVLLNGNDVSDGTGRGAIHTHRYNGLFARTGDGATIENISIEGFMNIRSRVADMKIGGAIAYLRNSATLSSVNATETINYYYANVDGTSGQYIGGLIGMTNCDAGKKVTIEGTSSIKAEIAPNIKVTGTCLTNSNDNVNQCIGGVIGYISSTAGTVASQTETEISNITLSATIDASGATSAANISMAGLISDIAWNSTDTRKLILNNIDVKNTVIKNKATNSTGGILGFRWLGTDVEFRNVKLDTDTNNNELNTTAAYIGALVYKGTGNWFVPTANGIVINSLDIKNGNNTATPEGLGIIAYNGFYSTSGLYLELANKDSYLLASSGLTIPTMTGKIYDELVACLSNSVSDLLKNNNSGVISYKTNGVYNMSNSRNSYNNKYNTTVVNNRSRYYYNADRNSYNSSKPGYKLLYWSLNRYVASNLKRCFTNPFSNDVLSGVFDMKNISYYPIDISKDVTIGASTFIFYNSDIESTETASNTKRSTRDGDSQHYLMHMGLFKDVSANIRTTGNITMYGSVGVNNTYSGALINGKLTGTLETDGSKKFYIGYYDDEEDMSYPLSINDNNRYLLINKIGTNAKLNLNGLYIDGEAYYDEANDCTNAYASSLIGDVQGTGISLNFSKIKIDARNKEGVNIKETLKKWAYDTSKSIFKNATLLNKYDVDSTSVAIYNFSQSEDYNASGTTHLANVTYGKELTSSVSYAGEEDKYYEDGENGNYIDPEVFPGAFVSGNIANDDGDHPYDFSSDYLPYVRYYNSEVSGAPSASDISYTLREIKVNVVPSDLSEGCGTYDHPYVIGSAKQMNSLALMLENADSINSSNDITNIRLPLSTAVASASHWCMSAADTNSCHLYKLNMTTSKYEYRVNEEDVNPTDTWNIEDVRAYLASAYYQVGNSFTLDDRFNGLGGYDSRYAFKGVIIGQNNGITITNKSGKPIIKISNGSVIKRLNIVVDNYTGESDISVVSSGSASTAFSYSDNDLVYGGVIGKIMGGDNIIDNVSITYNNNGYVQVEGSNTYLYCVGGYVGAIVNGALIFRNMSEIGNFMVNTGSSASSNFASSTDVEHLYINPYIGRVINGYAIYETNKYSGDSTSDKYTLDNSTKNYQISDINVESTNKITFGTYDSKSTIDIVDGQSLFVLSLITQSGAGTASSANGDYSYAVSYDGTNAFWSYGVNKAGGNYRVAAQNVATHLAKYDKVGNVSFSDKTLTTSDYYLSKSDTDKSKKAVPYIIYKYTEGSGTSYKARMVTKPGNTLIMRLTTENGTYNLPESFRGIGSICTLHGGGAGSSNRTNDEDGKYALELYGVEGNNATINMNLQFNAYGHGYDNYIATVYGNNSNSQASGDNTGINVGFGLFNYLRQIKASGNTTGYNTTTGYYIGNFNLIGSVDVKEYNSSGSRMDADTTIHNKHPGRLRTRYAVGGVISHILANDYVNFYKLNLKNFSVSGTSMVGGYIGKCNLSGRDSSGGAGRMKIYVNSCDTENLELTSRGGYCGGITAGYVMGFLDIYVNTAPNEESHMNMSITNTTNCTYSGTGGVVGTCMTGLNNIWINNVTISGMEGKAYIRNTSTADDDKQSVGGFIGSARKTGTIIITNSTLKDIDITGPCVGGVFGYIENENSSPAWGQSPFIRIYNCKISNDDVDDNGDKITHTIEGQKNAGGITGFFGTGKGSGSSVKYDSTGDGTANAYVLGYDEDPSATSTKYQYDIEGCEVSGYTIAQKKNSDTEYGVGGLIGYAAGTARTIVNSSVHNCVIKVEGSSVKHYMGGVVGYTGNSITGYNIASYDNTFTYQSFSKQTANICGNYIGKTGDMEIKVAGFSRQNNYRETSSTSKVVVEPDAGNGSYGSNGYIIDADYTGNYMTNDHGTAMSDIMQSGVTNVSEGIAENYFPYVTVSPYIGVGSTSILTGDGINLVNGSPVAKLIVNERESNSDAADGRIKYSKITTGNASDAKLVGDMVAWGEDTEADHDIKLTTYFNEMGKPDGYEGDDFPIIAIGGSADYTNYIKAYINVLTNSSGNYNAAGLNTNQESNKYKITIYPVRCINGVYQRVSATCGLTYTKPSGSSTYKYAMNDQYADSIQENNQISMIDICYCDPTATSKTAYHLYVPVLTKKLLKFNFSSTALQGTEYEKGVYEAKIPENWGDISKLGAGFDSWQTIYVKFDYTKEEMDEFLKTGKGLNWNTSKTLQFKYNSNKSLATSTEYVLLDNNYNVDKEYYKTKVAADTNTDSLGNKYDVINFSEFAGFSPQKLMHIAADKIEYTPDNNGKYVTCSKNDATVIAYDGNGNEVYFKAGTSGTLYTLTVKSGETISETYYLSMYTYDEDNVITATTHDSYGFTVECPMTFTSNIVTCQRNAAKNTNIYLGDFLEQTLTISNINDNAKITTDNHVINATLTSTITFAGDSKVYFNENLAGEKLYQNFYLYLNRYDEQGNISDDCTIKGNPVYTYTRTVDGSQFGAVASGGVDTLAPYFYVEPVEIEVDYVFGQNWSSEQTAVIELDFGANEAKLIEEFPARVKSTNDYRGIGLDAVSKIDFAETRVKYSNNIKDATDPPNKRYYIDRTSQNGVLTLTALDQPEYDGYDAYGEQSKNKSGLGINGKYIETGSEFADMGYLEHIDVGLDYDITNLPDEVLTDGGYNLDFVITLEQKENSNSSPGYVYTPVNIEDLSGTTNTGYLDNFEFMDKSDSPLTLTSARSGEQQDGYLYYTYRMPLSTNRNNWTIKYNDNGGQKHFTSNLGFDVKTEDLLKAIDGYKYANYRIKVSATISKGSTIYLSEDHVVYTNARVNAEYVVGTN